jgi:hypothetical protein
VKSYDGSYGSNGELRPAIIELQASDLWARPSPGDGYECEFTEARPRPRAFVCKSIMLEGIAHLKRPVTGMLRLLIISQEACLVIPAWVLRNGMQFKLPVPCVLGELVHYKWSLDFSSYPGGSTEYSLWMIGVEAHRN